MPSPIRTILMAKPNSSRWTRTIQWFRSARPEAFGPRRTTCPNTPCSKSGAANSPPVSSLSLKKISSCAASRKSPSARTKTYGMGLEVNNRWGIPIVHHGGSLFGYKSDWMILPESGIGAVLLTNSDNGGSLLGPLMRRLVEIVYDGKPEATASIDTGAANYRKVIAKERARLVYPADAGEAAKLAQHYMSAELSNIHVKRSGADTTFLLDGGESSMATRKNDDGTISFVGSRPTHL